MNYPWLMGGDPETRLPYSFADKVAREWRERRVWKRAKNTPAEEPKLYRWGNGSRRVTVGATEQSSSKHERTQPEGTEPTERTEHQP